MVTLDARAGKWILLALVVSLGVNLFLGGLALGRQWHGGAYAGSAYWRHGGEEGRLAMVKHMAKKLPPEHRAAFVAAMEAHGDEIAGAAKAVREARQKVRAALEAEPFDRAALESALAEVRARGEAMQKAFHAGFAEAAEKLPLEARRRLAEGKWKRGWR